MLLKRKGGAREDHQDGEPCPPTARSKGPVMSTSWGTVGTGKQHREAGTVFLSPIEGSPSDSSRNSPGEGTQAKTVQNHSEDTSRGKQELMRVTAS